MIKSGDYITRNSYKNDTLFLVLSVKGNMVQLKGVNDRLYADSPVDDCTIVDKEVIEDKFNVPKVDTDMDRNDYFYLPPRVLQLDGDSDYLKRCMNFYKDMKVIISVNMDGILVLKKNDILFVKMQDNITETQDSPRRNIEKELKASDKILTESETFDLKLFLSFI